MSRTGLSLSGVMMFGEAKTGVSRGVIKRGDGTGVGGGTTLGGSTEVGEGTIIGDEQSTGAAGTCSC